MEVIRILDWHRTAQNTALARHMGMDAREANAFSLR
jgi:hypothetical protein